MMEANPTMGGAPVLVEGPTEWYMLYCDGIYVNIDALCKELGMERR